ncbi:MAG: MATE family efflux transporter [Cellvibrionaceae bacterium]|nr:MATE family efflux transporter [Cellvibrionaceae bacterium]
MFAITFQYWRKEAGQILRLGIPLMIAHVAMVGLEVVDTMMAGQVSGEDLAGLAVAANIWLVIALFMGGWISATTPRFGRYNGAREFGQIRQEAQQAMLMAVLVGLLAMLLIWASIPQLHRLGTSPEVTLVAQNYLTIISYAMPFSGMIWVVLCLCEGCGDIRFSMASSLIALGLNAVLDYIFVFGKLGFPAMGAVGCAWTTLSVYFIWFLMGLAYVEKQPRFAQLKIFRTRPGLDFKRWRAIIVLGLPISLSLLAEEGFFSATALMIAPLGTEALGAHQITVQIVALVLMFSLGLGQATAIRLSTSIGAGDLAQALKKTWVGISLCLSFALLLGLLIATYPQGTLSLFTQDTGITAISAGLLVFAPLFLLLDSAQVSCAQILRGFEDTKVPMLIQIIGYWCLGFPLGYSLGATEYWGQNYGVMGFWGGFLGGISIASLCMGGRLLYQTRKLRRSQ